MKWYRNTWSIYYGNGNGDGSISIYNIILGPYLYNDKLYGTKELPMYSLYLRSAILDQNYEISPVSGKSLHYSYFRVVGVPDNRTISSSWGSEIPGSTISGQYKFSKNVSGQTFGGWSIPCNFILKLGDGTTFTGDSLQATNYTTRFPSTGYCGIVFKNVKEDKKITFGDTSSSTTSTALKTEQQYSVIDFGSVPQEIPAFIKNWIVANTEEVTEEKLALDVSLQIPNRSIRLKTENCTCERDINIIPVLQEKTVTENGNVIPDEGYVGLSKVKVDVPIGELLEITSLDESLLVEGNQGKIYKYNDKLYTIQKSYVPISDEDVSLITSLENKTFSIKPEVQNVGFAFGSAIGIPADFEGTCYIDGYSAGTLRNVFWDVEELEGEFLNYRDSGYNFRGNDALEQFNYPDLNENSSLINWLKQNAIFYDQAFVFQEISSGLPYSTDILSVDLLKPENEGKFYLCRGETYQLGRYVNNNELNFFRMALHSYEMLEISEPGDYDVNNYGFVRVLVPE